MTLARKSLGKRVRGHAQELSPGRLCDRCRAVGAMRPQLASRAYDKEGGGRDFFCAECERVMLHG